MGNIYWKDIKQKDKVVDKKTHYTVNGKTVYWQGNEAMQAQLFLRRRSKKSKSGWYGDRRRHAEAARKSRMKLPEGYVKFAGMIGYKWQKEEWEEVKKLHGKAYADRWARAKFKE